MIAKHIPINSVRKSSYEGLVNYIFDPQNKTERIGLVRSVNCYSDLPDCVIAQVLNTQQMNKRATSDKTYHLVVSFRDDELPDEVLQKVEDELCDGLGFGEHQRISVVHHDTDHLHVHIAINKIHPARFTIHNPHYDYKVIGELCEKLEQKYGLTPDNHETKKRGAQGRASNIEFKAGHDSLIGWIRQECLEPLQSVTSWTELHQVLSDHGLELQARGNGFVFVSGNGVGVKASSVDRSLSKSNLIKKLGVYKKINSNDNNNSSNNNNTSTRNQDARQYQQKPLHGKHDTTKLYSQYVKEQNDAAVNGRNQWHTLRNQKDRAIASARDQAKLKRLLIKSVTAGRLSKKLMHASVNQALKARIESIKKDYKAAYQASKTAHRRMDWLSWLVKESRRGNQEALAVLRSRKGYQSTENNISGTQTTEDSVKNDDVIETITKTGTVIINRGSTVIRDSGDRLFSVAGAAQEKILAVLQEAIRKFGHQLTVNGSDAYREKVVQVAVSANLDVTFDDEALERRRQALIQQENTQKPASGIDGGLASKDNALQQKVFKKARPLNSKRTVKMTPTNPSIRSAIARNEGRKKARLIQMMAIFFMLGGVQIATQHFAYIFQYQPQLGAHFNQLYPPWSIIAWSDQWYALYPELFQQSISMGVLFSAAGLILTLIMKTVSSNSSRPNLSLHGSARWAELDDIRAARLLPAKRSWFKKQAAKNTPQNDYVYVGAWQDAQGTTHYLKHNGPEHVLCYAPTRSGKGVGLVIPTLLSWAHSAVITDLKGELWSVTAGWRKQHAGNKVIRFDPASPRNSACWNPLNEIRMNDGLEVGDVQNLATLIVDPDGRGLNDHWQKTSQALLVGVILHALYKSMNEGVEATLPLVDAMLSDPERDIGELWIEMMRYPHVNGENHPLIGSSARDMQDRPPEEAGSVLSTAKSYLSLYRDPLVAKNISRSDFSIQDLMHHVDPVSLYIVTQPNDKTRLRPLVRIMANMIVRILADRLEFESGQPVANYKHRLLLMLDEFPSLGKLEIFQESLAYIAGYGIKAYLICQDINQLKSRETGYGHDEAITSNCHIQNAFPPNRIETAEHLSKLTGQTTVIKEQITTSGKRAGVMHGNVTRTMQETQRPLLTPDECLRMTGPEKDAAGKITRPGDMIIYVAGYPAIYGVQPLYFQDETFAARAAVAAPAYSDKILKQS